MLVDGSMKPCASVVRLSVIVKALYPLLLYISVKVRLYYTLDDRHNRFGFRYAQNLAQFGKPWTTAI